MWHACRLLHTPVHTCVKQTHTIPPPVHPHTHPTCSKLVAVNEAADACVLCKPTAPQWTPDTAWTTPHWDNLHCGMPDGGWRGAQANIGKICDRGAMKTLVLTGTHSFTFLSGSVVSHSHLFNSNCHYEGKHICVEVRFTLCVSDYMGH